MDDALVDLLVGYAAREKKALVNYNDFLEYAEEYAYNNNLNDLIRKVRDPKIEIVPTLMQWEYKGACTIFRKESVVDSILVHVLLKEFVNSVYSQIEQNPEIPFPQASQFGFQIPERLIFTFDLNTEFINFLDAIDTFKQILVQMIFPDNIDSIIIAKDIIKTRLIECAMLKLGRYLQFKMNVSYIQNRLESLLSGNLEAIKAITNDIITRPRKVVQQLHDADDFSFRFFQQFSSVIIKDYREKKDKNEDEHGFLQSAHLIGLYIGFQKSLSQRQTQKELEITQLEKQIKMPPYAFTFRDLYSLKDSRGKPFSEKYPPEFIQEFIRRMTKASDTVKLPSLISIKLNEEKDVFLHKDYVIPLFLNGLKEAGNSLYREYLDEWQTLLKNNTQLPSMWDDSEFINELNYKITARFPLLNTLRNPQLLLVIKDEVTLTDARSALLDKCFSKKKTLNPIDELLDLKREKILYQVKTLLPIWYTWPGVKHIFFLFKWLLGRSNRSFKAQALRLWKEVKNEFKRGAEKEFTELIASKKEEEVAGEARSATRKEIIAKNKSQIENLKIKIIGPTADLEELLEELWQKWNPLYDPEAKENLVEDVNCLIRDYIRGIKKSFRVHLPTASEVKNLAALLIENKSLQAIKKKETLKIYIEAYIIKILEEQFQIRT